jgi:periplasmic protein TonB
MIKMSFKKLNIKFTSTMFSVLIHVVIGIILFIFYSMQAQPEDLIEIGFGEPGGGSGGWGPMDKNTSMITMPTAAVPESEITQEKVTDEKKEDVPEVTSDKSDEDKVYAKSEKKINTEKGSSSTDRITAGTNKEGKGIGNGTGTGSGIGNGNGNGIGDGYGDGFGIDWGGSVRKIYNYNIPKYPEGVTKEIDVKLRFSILPDGSVGSIIVMRKADSRLEQVAIEALRLWRFEPLPPKAKQVSQITVITFPFRLN